jgi:inhibitor of KinA sporulation pathway (predicted exonuclease)
MRVVYTELSKGYSGKCNAEIDNVPCSRAATVRIRRTEPFKSSNNPAMESTLSQYCSSCYAATRDRIKEPSIAEIRDRGEVELDTDSGRLRG